MLYETDVIEALCGWLEDAKGYKIVQKLYTNETGDDIIAVKGNHKLVIEAKGETSSKEWTKRYGKPFTRAQVHDHVCNAFYRACKILTNEKEGTIVGLALPDNAHHREFVKDIDSVLARLGILIFWVNRELQIEVKGTALCKV